MNPRFLFILSPSPRCGTNFLFDVLSLDSNFQVPEIDEDYFIAGFSRVEAFLDESLRKSSLPGDGCDGLKAKMCYAISTALIESCSADDSNTPKGISLFKTPTTERLIDAFSTFPETCRFLVIVRDGRDVIESADQSFPWMNFAYAFNRWRRGCEELAKAEAIGSDRMLRIHYEVLLNHPVDTVTKILQWLEMPTESFLFEKIQALPIRGSSESKNSKGQVSWAPRQDPLSMRPDQRSLSAPRGRKLLFAAFGEEWNERFGYAPAGPRTGGAARFCAGVMYFSQSLRYRLRRSLRALAKRDIGGVPPLLP